MQVLPGLRIGALQHVHDAERELVRGGVTHLVNLSGVPPPARCPVREILSARVRDRVQSCGALAVFGAAAKWAVDALVGGVSDGGDDDHDDGDDDHDRDSRVPVVVQIYCMAGISRSTTVTVCVLLLLVHMHRHGGAAFSAALGRLHPDARAAIATLATAAGDRSDHSLNAGDPLHLRALDLVRRARPEARPNPAFMAQLAAVAAAIEDAPLAPGCGDAMDGVGGKNNGGASNGGASNGGASNGGASNGGASNGGASNGGTHSFVDIFARAHRAMLQRALPSLAALRRAVVVETTTRSATNATASPPPLSDLSERIAAYLEPDPGSAAVVEDVLRLTVNDPAQVLEFSNFSCPPDFSPGSSGTPGSNLPTSNTDPAVDNVFDPETSSRLGILARRMLERRRRRQEQEQQGKHLSGQQEQQQVEEAQPGASAPSSSISTSTPPLASEWTGTAMPCLGQESTIVCSACGQRGLVYARSIIDRPSMIQDATLGDVVYIFPPAWAGPLIGGATSPDAGDLLCPDPSCGAVVGAFDWLAEPAPSFSLFLLQ
jgi:uncharacterized membrane protein YgcG